MFTINKSLLVNILSLFISIIGILSGCSAIKSIGFYALSGALTNWIAIYMLFEKVPFLYGSGIITNKFESFKRAIKNMLMDQFFSKNHLDRFINENFNIQDKIVKVVAEKVDYNKIFDGFIDSIMASNYGPMIEMFMGGRESLESLRESFVKKIDSMLKDILNNDNLGKISLTSNIQGKLEEIIDSRLNELTPEIVKDIIQQMIREHLGWLVVWGAIFGGIIGLLANHL